MSKKTLYKTLGCTTPGAAVVADSNCCNQDNSSGNGSTSGNFVQVNADWNSDSGASRILNKPAILSVLKFLVNVNGAGVPDSTFDAYVAAGNTLHHDDLIGAKLASVQLNGTIVYDYGQSPITLSDGTINFQPVGGLTDTSRVIVFFFPKII
jgi:hypothetical protein